MDTSTKPVLVMMVGLPASGKSTIAYNLAKENNYIVFSSDALREELYLDINDQTHNHELFMELHKRIKTALKEGNNVIYDACNLSSKRRVAFLQELNRIPCRKECIIAATPYEQCLRNNASRDRHVPDYVIERMYKSFDTPYWFEGWDDIEIHHWNDKRKDIDEWINSYMDYDQDNPHHTLTLGEHCVSVANKLKDNNTLYYAGLLHDVGKPYTRMEKDVEIYVPIHDFEDLYAISNYGNVKNIKTNKVLKGRDNGHGYLSVTLGSETRKKRCYIHRLVAEHFLDIPECLKKYKKLDVNHIDSNKSNNFYKNLEWCTRSQNQNHAFQTNPNRNVSGFDKWQSKLSFGEVESIKFVKEHACYTNEKIGDMFGVDAATVSRIINNKAYITENKVFKKKISPILPIDRCRYYSHEHVGAYDSLFFDYPVGISSLTVSALISNHMKPWVWEKDNNEKMYNKYLKLWGDYFMQCVMILHEADKAAH